jgi:hypothetical protein
VTPVGFGGDSGAGGIAGGDSTTVRGDSTIGRGDSTTGVAG